MPDLDNIKEVSLKGTSLRLDPTEHKSPNTDYGVGDGSNYGHLKLTDTVDSTLTSDSGIAATPKSVSDAITTAENLSNATGTLALGKGGTGRTNAPTITVKLNSTSTGQSLIPASGNVETGISGILGKANGGTGSSNFGISVSGTTLVISGV